mmetsp:Transcript_23401/g.37604  ORF Transcript_23401/g.37604 Transcript_23401/m.37604 type:complete len:305 (-) Transcript_23401:185-1099(-)
MASVSSIDHSDNMSIISFAPSSLPGSTISVTSRQGVAFPASESFVSQSESYMGDVISCAPSDNESVLPEERLLSDETLKTVVPGKSSMEALPQEKTNKRAAGSAEASADELHRNGEERNERWKKKIPKVTRDTKEIGRERIEEKKGGVERESKSIIVRQEQIPITNSKREIDNERRPADTVSEQSGAQGRDTKVEKGEDAINKDASPTAAQRDTTVVRREQIPISNSKSDIICHPPGGVGERSGAQTINANLIQETTTSEKGGYYGAFGKTEAARKNSSPIIPEGDKNLANSQQDCCLMNCSII